MVSAIYERLWQALSGPLGVLVPLLVMVPLVVGYATLTGVAGDLGGATVQKGAIVLAMAIAAVLLGVRMPPVPVWVIALSFVAGYVVGLVTQARAVDGFDTEMLYGAAGYVYPWLAFFVDWRKVRAVWRATALALITPLTLVFAWTANAVGLLDLTLVRHEYTGALRLAAGMPPAYLAGLAFVGVAGSMWLWSQRRWAGFYLAAINTAVCAATGTRGATVAAAIVFLAGIVAAIVWRLPHWIAALGLSVIGGAIGASLILPTMLLRTTESADSAFAGSGRDAAWNYFLTRLQGRELTGFGPGSGPLLASQSQSSHIRDHFVSPHSVYVSLLVDIGAPLALAVGAGFVAIVVLTILRGRGPERVIVAAAGAACVWYGIFDNLLNAPQSALLVSMFFAMAWAGRRATEELGADIEQLEQAQNGDTQRKHELASPDTNDPLSGIAPQEATLLTRRELRKQSRIRPTGGDDGRN